MKTAPDGSIGSGDFIAYLTERLTHDLMAQRLKHQLRHVTKVMISGLYGKCLFLFK